MPPKPHASERFVRHARTFAIITLISRFFGLARDMLLSRLLGTTGIASAYNNAFQFPNTFRRLFGEGALSAAFIPEYTQTLERDPQLASRFASLTLAVLSLGLGAITLILEVVLALVLAFTDIAPDGRDGYILLMVMLPYMPLVCVTALMGGMLQTHSRFATQAAAPIVLNVCMIAAALVAGFVLHAPRTTIALWVSISVTLAGVFQLLWCLRDLKGRTAWTRLFTGTREPFLRMARRMGPVFVGLGAMQLCTLLESQVLLQIPLITKSAMIQLPWMQSPVAYPLDAGAGATLGYTQRLYQFPLGVFGIALATAVFPLLARQAKDPTAFLATLRRSIRLSLVIGLPASVGMLLVRTDLVAVCFLGREITAADVPRMASVLAMYAIAIAAFSLTHVLTRAFYAKGEMRLPMQLSLVTVVLTIILDVTLMWPLAERGLALSASIAAGVQCLLLLWFAHRLHPGEPTFDAPTLAGIGRTLLATAIMAGVLLGVGAVWDHPPIGRWSAHFVRLLADVAIGGIIYLAVASVLLRQELRWLRDRPVRDSRATPPEVR